MLILPIKKQWYDMILSGEKKEEYREIKNYYTTRFCTILDPFFNLRGKNEPHYSFNDRKEYKKVNFPGMVKNTEFYKESFQVTFRNGYAKTSPCFVAKCTLLVGTGKPEWGAEPGKEYYVLKILEIKS